MRLPALLALCAAAAACGNDTPKADAATPKAPAAAPRDTAVLSGESVKIGGFTMTPVRREAWTDVVTGPARVALDPANTEPIGSIVEGRVVQVYVMPGDRVAKGQVLMAIHSHEMMDARAGLARARAGLVTAQANQRVASSAAERAERLYNLKALALAELERARAAREDGDAMLEAARAELVRADAMVDHLVGGGDLPKDYDEHWVLVRAPIAGQVVTREAEPGNVVLIGAPLVTVSRTSSLVLVTNLPDKSASAVKVGALVQFTTNATGAEVFRARVTRVYPAIDTLTRTIEVHAAIIGENMVRLRPEMFATAEIVSGATTATVIVPAAAIQGFDGDTVVIHAEPRGTGTFLEAVRVRVGRLTRDRAEILAGIDTGKAVVVQGAAVAKAEILKRRGGAD